MNNISPKQNQAFPEACKIRKGLPKVEMKKGDYKFFGITNFHDLKDRFRFEFQEGVGEIRPDYQTKIERKDWNIKEIFHSLHAAEYVKYDMTHKRPGVYAAKDGFELKTIRAMVPCFNVLDAFYWANVANNAGTQIAVANDEQYISEKNPLNTREYIVKNSQPFKAWQNGEIISYKKGDKIITLPFKTDIRLSLFIPELERFVYFTLKSTSYYDRLQMQAHLNGIQFWANTLNNGNAAGIPLLIYRKLQDVTWNKPDGSAQQTKQWLINIEADPAWVKYASERMSKFAFGDGGAQKMLSAPPPTADLTGEYDPSAPDEDADIQDGEYSDETPTESTLFIGESAAIVIDTPTQATPDSRPYPPEIFKKKFREAVSRLTNSSCTDADRKVLASTVDTIFNGETTMRYEVFNWITGTSSTKDMTPAHVKTLLRILGVKSFGEAPSAESIKEFRDAHRVALFEAGQMELVTQESESEDQ